MKTFTQSGFDEARPLVASSEAPSGPDCVNNSLGRREGFSVDEKPFFKVWAAKALLSDDLASLTDHERSTWLYLLCVASLERPRWHVRITPRLAEKCRTTPPKLARTIQHMAELCMCDLEDDGRGAYFPTAEALNEDTYGKPPSAAPERVRERVKRHRETRRNDPVTPLRNDPVTAKCNDPVTAKCNDQKEEEKEQEEEEEEEEEEEKDGVVTLPDRDGLDVGFRERYGSMVTAYGGEIDQRKADEYTQLAEEESLEDILFSIRECRRANKRCYPSEIRARLPNAAPVAAPDRFAIPENLRGIIKTSIRDFDEVGQ